MLDRMNSGPENITEVIQCLTFKLDEEVFAIDISKVREVLEYSSVTKVPKTPNFMCGVINLRGSVVPVVDLRLKFGMPEAEKTVDTCIIIAEVTLEGETTVIGSLVDSVQEVFEFDSNQIEPAPRIGTKLDTEFIKGMGKRDDEFIIILDIDRVFSMDEFALIQSIDEHAQIKEHIPKSAACTPESSGS